MEISLQTLKNRIKREGIVKEIRKRHFNGKVYLVGGAIRELCLKKKPNDYDFALSEQKDLKILESLFGTGAFVLGKKPIQTYRIVRDGISVDITLLHATIEEDLPRRDFTMNAIAYDIHGDKIIDSLNGVDDIKKRIIRHPSRDTLKDDPLRMLKAIRHFSVLKGFTLNNTLKDDITGLGHLINQTAPERIKYEMDQITTSGNVLAGLNAMTSTGLIFKIFPELYALKQMDMEKGFTLETYGHTIDGFQYLRKYNKIYNIDEKRLADVGYALLFHDLGKAYTFSFDEQKGLVHFFYHERVSFEIASSIMERLRFSSHETRIIQKLIENHMRIFLISSSESTEKATRRLVYKMGDLTPSLILLTLCDMYGSSGGKDNPSTRRIKVKCREILNEYNEWMKEPLPNLVNGYDLIKLGFMKGPEIGKTLNSIREKQISGEIKEREDALYYAGTLLNIR
ncbi:MAG: HD domain-containing protein [Proteobacteria bacterium]|nr:HD domain-containing protein [Pseudomonadota bacterium]